MRPTTRFVNPRGMALACAAGVLLLSFGWPEFAAAALRSAAGGAHGGGGFNALTRYLDQLASYLIPVGVAGATLGVMVGGAQYISGNPAGVRTLGYVAVGVVIILASKGLVA